MPVSPGAEPAISPVMRTSMMEIAKEESAEYSQADSLPVGNDAQVENGWHQSVPEPHYNRPEKESKSCKPGNSQYYPSDPMSAIPAEASFFIFIFCCFHDFLF